MQTVESSTTDGVEAEPANSGNWLWNLILSMFGLAPNPGNDPALVEDQELPITHEDAEGAYVLAPCGYRIRVPDPADVGHSVGEMLPCVREGLNLLPPLPTVVVELLREIQDPKSTAASVAAVASSDPSLAASLLRTANGAAMGLSRTITSVSEAVSYLGFGTVKAMVIRLRLDEVMVPKNDQGARDAEDLWVHSLAVSYAAEALAQKVHGVDRGFVSTLGLLHDIGKMAILAQLPAESAKLREELDKDPALAGLALEAKLLGIDHAGLGANLAAKWKLPADLVQAIRSHHKPFSGFNQSDPIAIRKAIHLVQVANQLSKFCYPHSNHMQIDEISDEIFSMLGLEANLPKLLTGNVRDAVSRAIFFANENSKRPTSASRRFMRPIGANEAKRLVADSSGGGEPRVVEDEALIADAFSSEAKQIKIDVGPTPMIKGVPHAHFLCPLTPANIERCVTAARAHQRELELSPDAHAPAEVAVKSFIPNLLGLASPGDVVEITQKISDHHLVLGIRTPGLGLARRFGEQAPEKAARRIADADFGCVLNLGWFSKIAVSADGTTVVFVGQ